MRSSKEWRRRRGRWPAAVREPATAVEAIRVRRAALLLACAVVMVVSLGAVAVTAAVSPWSPAASMMQPHQAATATLLANGKVLVVGSFSQLNAGAELYDPAVDSWSPTGRSEE